MDETQGALWLVIGVAFIWYHSMKAREVALALALSTSLEMGMKLVDETISLSHVGLGRDPSGRRCLRRIYSFRLLDPQQIFHTGTLILTGIHLETILVESKQRDF
ncbi:MAG: DUF3301 domain-containing protein [Magnetococcus sp. DMHC-6]